MLPMGTDNLPNGYLTQTFTRRKEEVQNNQYISETTLKNLTQDF